MIHIKFEPYLSDKNRMSSVAIALSGSLKLKYTMYNLTTLSEYANAQTDLGLLFPQIAQGPFS